MTKQEDVVIDRRNFLLSEQHCLDNLSSVNTYKAGLADYPNPSD